MRGNPCLYCRSSSLKGSIPAHAGEPYPSPCPSLRRRVYPRACGGTGRGEAGGLAGQGLSPRMRGNLQHRGRHRGAVGSIPAHAGEPFGSRRGTSPARVYPRACGGTRPICPALPASKGLSPRMRGNRSSISSRSACSGSIPAHAGEPTRRRSAGSSPRVYPRACGGTTTRSVVAARS